MSRKQELFIRICKDVIVGVVREESPEDARAVARTYAENGLTNVEITMTTPQAISTLEWMAAEYPSITLAAGTIRNVNDAAAARRAGAQVLVSPHTEIPVIEYALEHDLLSIAGASTPTEIVRAWDAGADIVKVYPVMHLGGPAYIRTIRQPIRDIPMLAGGPVAIEQIDAYLDAGAVAVNMGGSLADPTLVRAKDWEEIGNRVTLATAIVMARGVNPVTAVH